MKIDRTTKLLLTIIAVGLWLNLLSTWLQPGQASAATGQTPYTEGISRKDAFFENLTVRNVTISDSNANLRIMIRGGEDGPLRCLSMESVVSLLGRSASTRMAAASLPFASKDFRALHFTRPRYPPCSVP